MATATQQTVLRYVVVLVMIATFVGVTDSNAQEPPKDSGNAVATEQATIAVAPDADPRVELGFADRQPDAATIDAVREAAEADGQVRVIVGIAADWAPEGLLSATEDTSQQAEIATLQDAVTAVVPEAPVLRRYESIPFLAMSIDAGELDDLLASDLVASFELDELAAPTLRESIPIVGSDVLDGLGFDGLSTTIAILDTGVEKVHPFMAGGVIYERCYSDSDGFSSTTAGDCPNGLNFQNTAGAGEPCTWDGCYHGTHVAGIAAGLNGNDGTGGALLQGVANGAWYAAYQVFHKEFTFCESWETVPCARTWTSDYTAALDNVYVNRAVFSNAGRPLASVNMSLGGGEFDEHCDAERASVKAAIDNLRSVGVATVISSGNSGYTDSMGSPACISTAISVGSTTNTDTVSDFSNVASFMDVFAPGSDITSSYPAAFGTWDTISGTSMAAPHVAGAFAILKQADPGASVDESLVFLEQSGFWVADTRAPGTIRRPRIWLDPCLANNPECFDLPANNWFGSSYNLATVSCDAANPCYSYLATKQTNEPDHAGNAGGNSVWFKWKAPTDGTVTISTFGSEFDTLLGVYTGTTSLGLNEVASNDDNPNGTDLTSKVTDIPVKKNVVYRIAVDGFSPVLTSVGPAGRVFLDLAYTPAANLCNGYAATKVGTASGETINGTSGRDIVLAGAGNDTINTFGGNDVICADAGNDVIDAGAGNDFIAGGNNDDNITGGIGNDKIYGSFGNDTIFGGDGNDFIDAGPGNDFAAGDAGSDTIYGKDNADNLRGGSQRDVLHAGNGSDFVTGQGGNDLVIGGGGPDDVYGGYGEDNVQGWGGDDDLFGGPADDLLNGGAGANTCDGGTGTDTLINC